MQHFAVVVVVPQLSLEELGQQPENDPMLTLPVLPKPDIPGATKQILEPRPDLRDTRLGQELLAEGRRDGEARGRAAEAAAAPSARPPPPDIQALPLEQLEAPADALWDFSELADLAAWLAEHAG